MTYDIYYFSGTGNSFKIAKEIADRLEASSLKKIVSRNRYEKEESSSGIGIITPVYVFGIPDAVRDFLSRIEKNRRVFIIVTHGGMPGVALAQSKEILEQNRVEITGLYSIEMPDNYIIMFDRPKDDKINSLLEKQEKAVEEIADDIKNRLKKNHELKSSKALNLINRIALKRLKRLSRGFYFNSKCNECGVCQRLCAVENIYLEDGKPKWKDKCEACMACIQWCPVEAIQYKKRTVKKQRYRNPKVSLQELME